ncbi:hypothetical protein R1flu_003023 [Riccia fluitans]|uniref:Uncharacterized protein n=1 Tax=Riccia fluitans TaxID=41844 RepID=A0ABD1Y806_9MARC
MSSKILSSASSPLGQLVSQCRIHCFEQTFEKMIELIEEWRTVALALGVLLFMFLFRKLGKYMQKRLLGHRAHLNQGRTHFLKAAALVAQAKNSKIKTGEARSLASTALQEADLAIQMVPNDAGVYIVKSLALELLGKPTAAVKVLDMALTDPVSKSLGTEEKADTLAKRAELLLGSAKGKRDRLIDEALVNLKESVKLSSNNPRVFLLLGTCYEKNGAGEQAKEAYKQCLLLNPSPGDAKAAVERIERLNVND